MMSPSPRPNSAPQAEHLMIPIPKKPLFFCLCMLGSALFGATMDSFFRNKAVLSVVSDNTNCAGDVLPNQKADAEITAPPIPVVVDEDMICHANPYEFSLLPGHSFFEAEEKALRWLNRIEEVKTTVHDQVSKLSHKKIRHTRFNGMEEMAKCNYTCTGQCGGDTDKIACGLEALQPGCIIYSIGGNNKWGFEQRMYQLTPCEIHTFDCTGPIERFEPPQHMSDRLHFHHICLATESVPANKNPSSNWKNEIVGAMEPLHKIQQQLGHDRLDILKMDIEGFEWPIMESWPELSDVEASKAVALPMQVLVEVHYSTQMKPLKTKRLQKGQPWKDEFDIIEFQAHLLRMGYVIANRDDNRRCGHCTELTLLRHKCLS